MLQSCFFVEEEDRCCERRVAYDYSLHLRNLHHLKQGNIAKLFLHLRNLHHEKQRNTAKLSSREKQTKREKKKQSHGINLILKNTGFYFQNAQAGAHTANLKSMYAQSSGSEQAECISFT